MVLDISKACPPPKIRINNRTIAISAYLNKFQRVKVSSSCAIIFFFVSGDGFTIDFLPGTENSSLLLATDLGADCIFLSIFFSSASVIPEMYTPRPSRFESWDVFWRDRKKRSSLFLSRLFTYRVPPPALSESPLPEPPSDDLFRKALLPNPPRRLREPA